MLTTENVPSDGEPSDYTEAVSHSESAGSFGTLHTNQFRTNPTRNQFSDLHFQCHGRGNVLYGCHQSKAEILPVPSRGGREREQINIGRQVVSTTTMPLQSTTDQFRANALMSKGWSDPDRGQFVQGGWLFIGSFAEQRGTSILLLLSGLLRKFPIFSRPRQ